MAVNGVDTVITGRVVSVNERGLRLEGEESWRNVSKFAVGVVLPDRGSYATLTLDKGGFIRACELADGSAPTNGAQSPGIEATSRVAASGADRDRTITRLAVLKAAAEFGAARPELRSRDVIAIAAVWERWVLSPDIALPAEPELDEAF